MAITGTIFAYLIGIMLLFQEGLFIAPLFPLVIGYLYTKGIRFGSYSFKLKGGAGIKNMVIGLTWGGYIAMVVAHWTPNPLLTAPIFMFFGLKLFINSTLFDLKDIAGDLSVGIRTIPAYLGERGSKYLLVFLSLILHLLMIALVWGGYMRPEITILTYSFLIGAPFIYFYSTEWEVCAHGIKKNLRQIAIQSESGIALALRFIMGVGPGVIVLSNG
jgi:4-hydroxybenzoate polyprenyltransferase